MRNMLNKEVILQEMRHLLEYSCNDVALENHYYDSLHSAILKKHFKADDVTIDYLNRVIHLNMCVEDDLGFFGKKSYVDVEMNFTHINEFLQNCIEETDQNLMFYRNILNFYNTNRTV